MSNILLRFVSICFPSCVKSDEETAVNPTQPAMTEPEVKVEAEADVEVDVDVEPEVKTETDELVDVNLDEVKPKTDDVTSSEGAPDKEGKILKEDSNCRLM